MQTFVNPFSFHQNWTKKLPFILSKMTLQLILYVIFYYITKDIFDITFVESKMGLDLICKQNFDCYKTIDFCELKIIVKIL